MARKPTPRTGRTVEALRHRREDATRKNIPTAEHQPVLDQAARDPVRVAYARRNRDLDPQLVWRGKDEQDWSDRPARPGRPLDGSRPHFRLDRLSGVVWTRAEGAPRMARQRGARVRHVASARPGTENGRAARIRRLERRPGGCENRV